MLVIWTMLVVFSLICRTGSLRCNIDTIAMNTIFCTVVLSVIQGVALNTGVLPLLKGRALQEYNRIQVEIHTKVWITTK